MSNFTDSQAALSVAIAARVPVLLWGAPGQGKTQSLYAIARENGMHLETVLASIREPSDFAGLPYVVDGRTTLIAPDWAQRIKAASDNGQPSMLFFDELSTAAPASQAALLRVALERVAGDLYLGDDVAIVAAANPPAMAADGWDLPLPTSNRFVHLDWALDAETVRTGFALGWPEVHIPTLDPDRVATEVARARTLVSAFLTRAPQMVTVIPSAASESNNGYPTPRSWEVASILYGYAVAAGIPATARRMLMNGTIGQGASAEFLAYIDALDLPDPEQVLADPASLQLSIEDRADRVYAIGVGVLGAVKGNLTEERWVAVGAVIARIVEGSHTDVAVSLGSAWIAMRPTDQMWRPNPDHLTALIPVMTEAQMIPVSARR